MQKVQIRKIGKKNFPYRLKEINDCPEYLYLRGELPSDEYKWLAIVGSRKYSNYGREVCEKLISELRGQPIVIVSGLALGIDSIAHKSALEFNLPTVAVPGSGLGPSVLYPRTNVRLADEIISAGGCLLSEFEPDFKATPYSFPQRNRIMAGLCDAVLVIEAEEKSGTLITSKLAMEYNRDVFTVPGSIFSSTSSGPHMLLKLGANLIRNGNDILEALGIKIDETPSQEVLDLKYKDCSPEEMKIIEILKTPMSKEDLLSKIEMPISSANAIISIMEIKGLIKESGGEFRLS